MTQNFMFPVSGGLRELSENARLEIERRFPNLPVGAISNEAGWYVIIRDAPQPSPDEARKTLQQLRRQSRELHDAVAALGQLRTFVDQAAGLIESPVNLDDFQTALLHFDAAFSKAATFIPEGRRRSPRERLVRCLVTILREAGEAIDAKPQGTLCVLMGIVLEDVNEKPTDVRKIVQPVVDALETSKNIIGEVSIEDC